MAKKKDTMLGNMMTMGIGNIVGTGLIGATASSVNAIPAGLGHDIAAVVPGLQSTALVGANVGMVNKSFGFNGKSRKTKVKKTKVKYY